MRISLGKLVLVIRDNNKRLEGVAVTTLELVGTNDKVVYKI